MNTVQLRQPKAIVTDIEGTTTSVAFVYDTLFPYFSERIATLRDHLQKETVATCFANIKALVKQEDGCNIDDQGVLETLATWVKEDRKETNLKSLQGYVWKEGYLNGDIKGHIYAEVPDKLNAWHNQGIKLYVYSSGSVAAQKLLFGYSEKGDLTSLFHNYFDTQIGMKKEVASYQNIAAEIGLESKDILFLSDIEAELDAAQTAGYETIQLVRPGTQGSKKHKKVETFEQITFD